MDLVIIVSERAEDQRLLAQRLRRHDPALSVEAVGSLEELGAVSRAKLGHARLIGFCTDIVVPAHILAALGFGAYNIHPGPPDYPGWAAASFAVYDRATRFGATAHVMKARVDSGAIVGTSLFAVPPDADQAALELLTYSAAIDLFDHLAAAFATRADPLPAIDVAWGTRRCTRAAYAAMCRVPHDAPEHERLRRLRAFGAGPPGLRLVVMPPPPRPSGVVTPP